MAVTCDMLGARVKEGYWVLRGSQTDHPLWVFNQEPSSCPFQAQHPMTIGHTYKGLAVWPPLSNLNALWGPHGSPPHILVPAPLLNNHPAHGAASQELTCHYQLGLEHDLLQTTVFPNTQPVQYHE